MFYLKNVQYLYFFKTVNYPHKKFNITLSLFKYSTLPYRNCCFKIQYLKYIIFNFGKKLSKIIVRT